MSDKDQAKPGTLKALAMRAPTWQERVSDAVRDVYEQAAKQPAIRILDMLGVSDIAGVAEEMNRPNTGLRVGAMPGGPGKTLKAIGKGIKAFHGSPHDFEKFDISKIGTGEGAQAYGHGLYFAENPKVAEEYKKALEAQHAIDNKPLVRASEIKEDPQAMNAVQDLWNYIDLVKKGDTSNAAFIAKRLDAASASSPEMRGVLESWQRVKSSAPEAIKPGGGHMYEVRIHADPEQFLDWDKPLSQQSEKVRQALGSIVGNKPKSAAQMTREELIDVLRNVDPNGLYTDAENVAEYGRPASREDLLMSAQSLGLDEYLNADLAKESASTGQSLYRQLTAQHGGGSTLSNEAQRTVTSQMQKAGIPGIKYLDRGSRSSGDGTRNYVVFNDALIEIKRKYGWLAPLMGAGAFQQWATEQAQAQANPQ